MTKNNYKININNMYYLVFAVYTDFSVRKHGKDNPYGNLLSQVDSYKKTDTPFDPKFHNIDDFMVDAYRLYEKYMTIEDKLTDVMQNLGFGKMIDPETIEKEFHRITSTFEEIIMNCDFEGVQIRGIQKNFLGDKMKDAVDEENYELAAKLRDKIKSI